MPHEETHENIEDAFEAINERIELLSIRVQSLERELKEGTWASKTGN